MFDSRKDLKKIFKTNIKCSQHSTKKNLSSRRVLIMACLSSLKNPRVFHLTLRMITILVSRYGPHMVGRGYVQLYELWMEVTREVGGKFTLFSLMVRFLSLLILFCASFGKSSIMGFIIIAPIRCFHTR